MMYGNVVIFKYYKQKVYILTKQLFQVKVARMSINYRSPSHTNFFALQQEAEQVELALQQEAEQEDLARRLEVAEVIPET